MSQPIIMVLAALAMAHHVPRATGVGVIRVARRIYVSNLTWRTSWQDLKDHFKQAGRGVAFCCYV